ncbi:MAG: AAA family ATPase [Desulforhopalus sp.]
MYTSFYKLNSKPFEKNPDRAFLWLSESSKGILTTLHQGIRDNKGLLLLMGEAGSGKTTLMNSLVQSVDRDIEWAVIADPRMEKIDFYNAIARGFGIEKEFTSKVQFLIQFSHFLHEADDNNKKVLLLVDDCHLLSQEMLEELRLLSNIEKAGVKLINILFVGLPAFNALLAQPKNRAVRQRLSLIVQISPFNISETDDYIRHRLKVAGAEERLFGSKAVQAVHHCSKGIPRQINSICKSALESGSVQNKNTIDGGVVNLCVRQMHLPGKSTEDENQSNVLEKSDRSHAHNKQKHATSQAASSYADFNFARDKKRGWLKYGLGFIALSMVSVFYWFSGSDSLDKTESVTVGNEEVPIVRRDPADNGSPVVTMLEKKERKIDEKKAAELKAVILERAYRGTGDITGKETVQPVETSLETGASDAGMRRPQVEAESGVAKVDKVGTFAGQAPRQRVDQDNTIQEQEEVAAMAPMEPRKILLNLRSNSLDLTSSSRKELDSFLSKLKEYPQARVLIKGFVSSKSNSPENIILSEDRALNVQKIMLAEGFDEKQIEVVGMGNQEPIASNATSEGRRKNRRVEIIIVSDGT